MADGQLNIEKNSSLNQLRFHSEILSVYLVMARLSENTPNYVVQPIKMLTIGRGTVTLF